MKKMLIILALVLFTTIAYADILVELKVKKFGFEFNVQPIYQTVNYPIDYTMTLNEVTFKKTNNKPLFHYIWHPNPAKTSCFQCTFEITDSSGIKGYDQINITLFDEEKLKENFAYFDMDTFTLHLFHVDIDGKFYNFSLTTKDNEHWNVINKVESFPDKQTLNYHYFIGKRLVVRDVQSCLDGIDYRLSATFNMLSEELFLLESVTNY
jgi:hypothetical protein